MKKICLLAGFILSLTTALFASRKVTVENQPQVLELAKQLPNSGHLINVKDSTVCLKISDEFLEKLVPLIASEKIINPPHYISRAKQKIGAHILVFPREEYSLHNIRKSNDILKDKVFTFTVTDVRTLIVKKKGKIKKLWQLGVSSPELEKVRKKYTFRRKMRGYGFYINLGSETLLISSPNSQ